MVGAWAFLLTGCGHPATREECTLIIDKSAELTLREQGEPSPEFLAERVRAFKEAQGEELLEKCVGRPITASALECVQRAETAAGVDRCLY